MLAPQATLKLQIRMGSWDPPPVFRLLQSLGNVAPDEMRRTFNMGIGMIVAVDPESAEAARVLLEGEGETVYRIGQVAAADAPDQPVEFLE